MKEHILNFLLMSLFLTMQALGVLLTVLMGTGYISLIILVVGNIGFSSTAWYMGYKCGRTRVLG